MNKRNGNKKGYKNIKADYIPEGWKKCKLGELFVKRTDRGRVGLPVLSVTLNNGLIERNSIARKMDTNLEPEEHLLIKRNDIAYNMMRMWQGASGMASYDGIISPAYIVLKPQEIVDPHFAAHWFKSARMIYLFWAYSYGLTGDRLRLYFKDFSLIPVFIPPLYEQKAIANIFSTWNLAIEKTEHLIAAKEKLFKWLLNNLISQKNLDGEWERLTLGVVGETYTGISGKTKEDFGKGKPFVTYMNVFQNIRTNPNQLDFVDLKTKEKQNIVLKGDVLFTTSSETPNEVGMSSVLLDDLGECYLNSFCFGWRPKTEEIIGVYLQYFFRSALFRQQTYRLAQGATRYNLSKKELMKTFIFYPPIDQQKQIAATLNTTLQEIALLEKRKEAYIKQKYGLMQKLLTGEIRVKI